MSEKKIFTVVVERRQKLEIDVDAFDARGARGQVEDGIVVQTGSNRPEWRIVGQSELVVVDAYEKQEKDDE